ncbi:hypothetical protein PN836_015445 [Ningiella sp. W23]|uniref:hypothetical protein n=1 Tax=Ningiella sp. W23 TaxID=3023715 RepID=UPI003757AFCD
MLIYKLAFVLGLTVLLAACGSTSPNVRNNDPVLHLQSESSIVVLGRRHILRTKTERDYVSCVGESLSERSPQISVIPEQHFTDALYPFFESSVAPLNEKNLGEMLKQAAIAEKLDELNVRYLVWIHGNTQRIDESGGVSCAVGPGGGGCFGFATWEDEAIYEADVWELDKLSSSSTVVSQVKGTSYMPAIIIPIPILARVQSSACEDLSRRIWHSMTF